MYKIKDIRGKMKVNAIVAEYNPFHNGHLYHLTESKSKTGADYTIVIMSGNFVQRGAPAICNKFDRAKMALQGGADLVLELPVRSATGSAEEFAKGAVTLLNQLNIVDYLSFGSECGSITPFLTTASLLTEESPAFRSSLKENLSAGLSYPAATDKALQGSKQGSFPLEINQPNNILGLEYCKALLRTQSRMKPVTILRREADYHDLSLSGTIASAQAIRTALLQESKESCEKILSSFLPPHASSILLELFFQHGLITARDFSSVLHYSLMMHEKEGYTSFLGVTPGISDRIQKLLYAFQDYDQFCSLVKTKNVTYHRISRCLLHILLGIQKESTDKVPYARVLGLRRDASPLLAAIKTSGQIPLITKLADASNILSDKDWERLQEEIRISHIYYSIASTQKGLPMINEYRHPLAII